MSAVCSAPPELCCLALALGPAAAEGVPGCAPEFLAYRLIYQAVHAKHGEILQLLNTLKKVTKEVRVACLLQCCSAAVLSLMCGYRWPALVSANPLPSCVFPPRSPDNHPLCPCFPLLPAIAPHLQEVAHPAVRHALQVRAALAAADVRRFFRLYAAAPALGRALMDVHVPTLRFEALGTLVKAYKPSLPLTFLAGVLGFVKPPPGVVGAGAGVDVAGKSSLEAAGIPGGAADAEPPVAAAAAGELEVGNGGGGVPEEPLPGCMETHWEGEHAAQVGRAGRGGAGWVRCCCVSTSAAGFESRR